MQVLVMFYLHPCTLHFGMGAFETEGSIYSILFASHINAHMHALSSHFLNNSATRGSADSTALTAYRVLLTFNGNSSFVNNFGGGMSLLGSRMDVQGEVNLDRNFAVFGAGIAMTGRSLVRNGLGVG